MMLSPRFRARVILPVSLMIHAMPCHGGSGTWTNPGGGSWTAVTNWTGAQPADGTASIATFPALTPTRKVNVLLDGSRTVGGIVFGSGESWSLRKGNGGSLTLDVPSGLPAIQVDGSEAIIGTTISGSDGFRKTGDGTLVLAAANAFSGAVQVEAGRLRLAAPPAFPATWTVMPVGDSITYGWQGTHAGYRGPLHDLLVPFAPGLRFVGSSSERPGLLPTSPVNQTWHEGHSSYNLDDISDNLDGLNTERFLQYGGPDRNPNGGHWLTGGNGTGRAPLFPDAILLLAGTNDLGTSAGAEQRLRDLLEKITTLRPNTCVFVAKITPIDWHFGVIPYNAIVQSVVADFQKTGRKVRLVDLHTGFPSNGTIADGVHPNDTGFFWMAAQWHEELLRAYSPVGGTSSGLPPASVVNVARGATLDLAGTTTSTGAIACYGTLDLASGGNLTAPALYLLAGSMLVGSGSIQAPVVQNGALSIAGELEFRSTLINNGSLIPSAGGSVTCKGDVTNNGILTGIAGASLSFDANVTNNGVIRMTGGASLHVAGNLVNLGVIDLLTGSNQLPPNFTNLGVVIDSRDVAIHDIHAHGTEVTVRIRSHTGHGYQLQRAPRPDGPWANEGAPQPGSTGGILTFRTPAHPPRGFLRIKVDP